MVRHYPSSRRRRALPYLESHSYQHLQHSCHSLIRRVHLPFLLQVVQQSSASQRSMNRANPCDSMQHLVAPIDWERSLRYLANSVRFLKLRGSDQPRACRPGSPYCSLRNYVRYPAGPLSRSSAGVRSPEKVASQRNPHPV